MMPDQVTTAAPPGPTRTKPAGQPLPTFRRRQPRWILAGLLALALGALGSVVLWTRVADTSTVLRVDRTVYRGEVITAQHLSPVSVGHLAGVDAVASEELPAVVGQRARTDLAGGSLLTHGSVGRPESTPDSVVVGLRLEEGRVPRAALEPGTPVLLVETASTQPGATSTPGTRRAFRAEVHRPTEPSADQVALLVDVTLPRGDAEAVARLAAEDRIVLVRST